MTHSPRVTSSAGLVFETQFFPALVGTVAMLASFATPGVSFVARPIGGVVPGHMPVWSPSPPSSRCVNALPPSGRRSC